MLVLNIVVLLLLVLVILGYFTLLERNLLGYGQLRNGPNNGMIAGLFQPLLDGFNLFFNGSFGLALNSGFILFIVSAVGLTTVLILWGVEVGVLGLWGVVSSGIILVVLSALVSILYFLVGFGGGSVYSLFGAMRLMAIVLTYEGILFVSIIGLLLLSCNISWNAGLVWSVISFSLYSIFFVGVVLESGRTPVDFVEGESELVSGITTELGGLSFSFLFLLEYGSIGVFSCICVAMLVGSVSPIFIGVISVIVIFVLNWLRLSLPRSRYDLVIEWGWNYCLIVCFILLIDVFCLLGL